MTTPLTPRSLSLRPCTDIECGLPASIPHGAYDLLNGTVGYLSTVMYRCHDGHEMLGRALLTCDIDERWNGPPPRCEPIECDALPDIENGEIIAANGTFFGARAELVCDEGYRAEGGAVTVLCSGIGQWSEVLAVCVPGDGEAATTADSSAPVAVNVPVVESLAPTTTTASTTTTAAPVTTAAPFTVTPPRQRVVSTQASRRPTRPSTRHTSVPTRISNVDLSNVNDLDDVSGGDDFIIPGTVQVTMTPRPPVGSRPSAAVNGHANNSPPPLIGGGVGGVRAPTVQVVQRTPSSGQAPPLVTSTTLGGKRVPTTAAAGTTSSTSTTAVPASTTVLTVPTTKRDPLNVIQAAHPQDNEIASSVNIR